MVQLSAFGDLANNIENLSEVANDINQYICVSEDATVLTRGVNDAIKAVESISVAVSKVSAAISSGQVPSSINDSLEEWSDAESVFLEFLVVSLMVLVCLVRLRASRITPVALNIYL